MSGEASFQNLPGAQCICSVNAAAMRVSLTKLFSPLLQLQLSNGRECLHTLLFQGQLRPAQLVSCASLCIPGIGWAEARRAFGLNGVLVVR
jgi:hypothetical protein